MDQFCLDFAKVREFFCKTQGFASLSTNSTFSWSSPGHLIAELALPKPGL